MLKFRKAWLIVGLVVALLVLIKDRPLVKAELPVQAVVTGKVAVKATATSDVVNGQVLQLPPVKQRSGSALQVAGSPGQKFSWPLYGPITSRFGRRNAEFHTGVDIAANLGTDITAARAGKVVFAGWQGGYGRVVKLDHGDGTSTLYAHTSRLLVKLGQKVAQGEVIAKVGSTGRSTGPHLHFEIRKRNLVVNPISYLGNQNVAAANL
ncbi:MAG TPA: M23 family metallopeptidase [Desulfobacteria bacterium]|nr:M23 family metallopeptidase [Desulfobacteria bacterium]